jgi:hypothetical protein
VKVQSSLCASLGERVRVNAIIIDFSKAFDLDSRVRLLTKLAASGVDPRVVVWVREFLVVRTQMIRVGRATIQGSQGNHRCVKRELFGPNTVSSERK